MAEFVQGDNRKECCKDPGNLYRRPNDPEERKDLIIMRCKVCECRHFELSVDPLELNLKGKPVGGEIKQ